MSTYLRPISSAAPSQEAEAFAALWRAEHPRVVRVAAHRLRSSLEAENVAQDVCIKMWRRYRDVREPRLFAKLANTLIKTTTVDVIRREQRVRRRQAEWMDGERVRLRGSSRVEDLTIVELLPSWIKPNEAAAVALIADGWTHEQAAARTGLTRRAVKALVADLREFLTLALPGVAR